ncbi:sugar phosphate isomerase/epimerase family protein [Paenibacillus thermotolerans]|uniref:sugar phosphate isomerase/epimerase family protein n=1 Tax=Paenibacillus thermotolerans TaxID=3027807 RepID=UPI002368A2AE|nr:MULTISPECIES: sugar phosphate isomerase/epimerase [unclassified Paenibacillus]
MDKTKIAAQLYTVRDFCQTEQELESSLRKIKSIGYAAVQLSGIGPIEPERVKQLCDDNGLSICAIHTGYDRLKHDLDGVLAENRMYGNRYIGIGGIPSEYRGSGDGYRAFAKEASEIARAVADQGMRFIYHNHHFEFEKFNGQTGMDILFAESDPHAFHFELDTYWVQAGGANPVDWIRKVTGRMGVVHLKDMAIVDNKQIFAEIGEGNLDWNAIIRACRECGVKWYVVEQDTSLRDPFESLEISYQNLLTYI